MSVWLTIPSARPNGGTASLWKAAGYKIALWRDTEDETPADLTLVATYPGYANAVNALCEAVIEMDPKADWLVAGGDDTEPDPNHSPGKIAFECGRHFGEIQGTFRMEHVVAGPDVQVPASGARMPWSTFGVCQPTGDRFAEGSIDRICGSPWMGREFCRRMYGGNGPLYQEYVHMFVDEELQEVAIKLGVLWQRRDLIHLHHHFMRESVAATSGAVQKPTPIHLVKANSPEHWNQYKALFQSRKAWGFPGHEPLPV